MRTVDTLLHPQLGLTVFVDRDGVRPGDRWRSVVYTFIASIVLLFGNLPLDNIKFAM